ncbi:MULTISPECIES: DUF423 domain-containing protein [Spongiibacter]|uniref:DUF423 domain-containing protein n=1 Tax=Spongiibacter TaxID=630749 RepID=UPI001B09A957|nr:MULTISPECIES: DUF423 domain-containing protein [Spongiibacter]MBO6752173.1 DUF423 domain-containing protein [Spongiibacter sp.]|tara:strand:+ start:26229 stop:26597 length:369 start_codon:yes stop_codon:yes gene_type:complete
MAFLLAGISGFLAVALGAFGAHGLKQRLSADMMAVYETAVQYHFYHTLALLLVAVMLQQGGQSAALRASVWLFGLGIVVFSGSLYALAISGVKILGAITPIGGVLFLIGWACLAYTGFRSLS